MKYVVAALAWVVGSGCALADVYKWTDANGEVHYGDFPTRPNAEKIMTQEQIQQEQIQQEENAEKAAQQTKPPPSSPDYAKEALDEEQHQENECQRYKNLRTDLLMNSETPIQYGYNRMGYGFGYGLGLGYGQQNTTVNTGTGMSEIMSGIQKYCQ